MKNILLAAMAVMTLAGPASATSDWDMFWGTTMRNGLDPKLNGWDDFWGQCQNPDKNAGDCIGVVAAGLTGAVFIVPVIAGAATLSAMIIASGVPMVGTTISPVAISASGTVIFI